MMAPRVCLGMNGCKCRMNGSKYPHQVPNLHRQGIFCAPRTAWTNPEHPRPQTSIDGILFRSLGDVQLQLLDHRVGKCVEFIHLGGDEFQMFAFPGEMLQVLEFFFECV